jgi:membrane dipeptidase
MTPAVLHADPETFAERLGVSREAAALITSSHVLDLHVDTFIWQRILDYDPTERHASGRLAGLFLGQADLPRLREAGFTGATWVVTTNPLRSGTALTDIFTNNIRTLEKTLQADSRSCRVVRKAADYYAAQAAGQHAAFIGVQGGDPLAQDPLILERLPPLSLLRVTLVHLYDGAAGRTSTPLPFRNTSGLGPKGEVLIEALDAARVFVDLAHSHPEAFWRAVDVHRRDRPLLVSHTGVSGVHRHWRNLDDAQLRAVADTGGVVGILYHAPFLGRPFWKVDMTTIARHIEHAINVAGEDHVAFGSDWDGAIITPRDMPTCLEFPRLVQRLLDLGHSPERLQKLLGLNFLGAVAELRG